MEKIQEAGAGFINSGGVDVGPGIDAVTAGEIVDQRYRW